MSPDDYRRLCPNSGRVLRDGERGARTAGRRHMAQCACCGQHVEVRPYTGSGQSLLYTMHFRDESGRASAARASA